MYNETSENLDKITITNDGYCRRDRLLKAMREGYIKIDERSFEDLLEFAVEFGGLINFYNLNNKAEGDWAPFFLTDESIILASIINCDLSDLEIKYRGSEYLARQGNDTDGKFNLLRELFAKILYMARKIDLWLKVVNQIDSFGFDVRIQSQIVECVHNGPADCLRKLRSYDQGAGMSGSLNIAIGLNYDNFTPAWGSLDSPPEGSIYSGRNVNEKINNAVSRLNSIFYTFFNEINHLKDSLQTLYYKSLDKDDHQPDVALYIAFLKLFSYAQSSINSYIGKYRDFYYDDILREAPQGPISDNVYLCCEADPTWPYRPVAIEKGALFSAGDDKNGNEVRFSMEKDLFVNSASIVKHRLIYRKQAPLFEIVNVFIPAQPANPNDKKDEQLAQLFVGEHILSPKGGNKRYEVPALGDDVVASLKDYTNNPAILGFAVASKCLEMTSGERTVSFRLYHTKSYTAKLDRSLSILAGQTGMSGSDIYKECLLSAFTVWFSSAFKWIELKTPYTVALLEDVVKNGTVKKIRKGFQIDFSLSDGEPAIENFDPGEDVKKKDDGYSCNPVPELPTVKFYLNNEPLTFKKREKCISIQAYPLSILNDFELSRIAIDVSVDGFNNFNLRNNSEELPPDKPFNPFGAEPTKGSYFQIEGRELFEKPVTGLNIKIDWKGLPPNEDGFYGYYKDYVLGIDGNLRKRLFFNEVFKCKFSVVDPDEWQLNGAGNGYNLFSDEDAKAGQYKGSKVVDVPSTALAGSSEFKLNNIAKLAKNEETYYGSKKSGIKVELTDPPYGFGFGLFEANTQYAALANIEKLMPATGDSVLSKSKIKDMVEKGETMNNPNPPYSPVIKTLSVSYTASDELIFNKTESTGILFFHLNPFEGWQQINSVEEKPEDNDDPCDCCKNNEPPAPGDDSNNAEVKDAEAEPKAGGVNPPVAASGQSSNSDINKSTQPAPANAPAPEAPKAAEAAPKTAAPTPPASGGTPVQNVTSDINKSTQPAPAPEAPKVAEAAPKAAGATQPVSGGASVQSATGDINKPTPPAPANAAGPTEPKAAQAEPKAGGSTPPAPDNSHDQSANSDSEKPKPEVNNQVKAIAASKCDDNAPDFMKTCAGSTVSNNNVCFYCKKLKQSIAELEAAVNASKSANPKPQTPSRGCSNKNVCFYCIKLKQSIADLDAAVKASKSDKPKSRTFACGGPNKYICSNCQKLKQLIKDLNEETNSNTEPVGPEIPYIWYEPHKSECPFCDKTEHTTNAGQNAPGKSPCSCNDKPKTVITIDETDIVVTTTEDPDPGHTEKPKPEDDLAVKKEICCLKKREQAIIKQDAAVDKPKPGAGDPDNPEIVNQGNAPIGFAYLLPQFASEGCLMLGFDNVEPPRILSLLFMFLDNSVNTANEEPGAVSWYYLSGNEWKKVEDANILSDQTNGLQNNGIITFNLPEWENSGSTIMEPEYWWLKASSNENIKAFPKIVNIWINAGIASWVNNDETGERLKAPLPESTIKAVPDTVKGVSKVEQPYNSFNGKPEETRNDMLIRVGERLSHKDRAIMPNDYERLVLQRYPQIHMVKCLPARTVSNCNEAGNVVVVVVRAQDAAESVDPLTPMANNQMLTDIESYLIERMPPFVKLHVVNPVYCRITVTVSVGFRQGTGAGASAERLNDDIVNNLSPWYFDPERAENKSSYFLKPCIADFIQNRSYVDYITSLTLSYDPKPLNDPNTWLYYTSAEKHDITIIYDNPCV